MGHEVVGGPGNGLAFAVGERYGGRGKDLGGLAGTEAEEDFRGLEALFDAADMVSGVFLSSHRRAART
jgi:hypothetical protein